ncbi:unnamed protein product [Caenorhabditis sp. 36 PRJEB53466]|nr:unnamed protein product [Caenorhabditis sp. 36 PRJEB53466]
MEVVSGLKEEAVRKFLSDGGQVVAARPLERFQLQITAVSREGRLLRGVLGQKSRVNRELMHREIYETPYIVELPGDHSEGSEDVRYSVSLPRKRRVIALRYEERTPSTSSEGKTKRIRTAAQLLGEKEDYCCRTCFKRFTRKFNLERHEESCLPKPILYQCPVCQRKYQKAPYFAAHIRMHEDEERKQEARSNRLAIQQNDVEEMRRQAEQSVDRLAIPYEFGAFL